MGSGTDDSYGTFCPKDKKYSCMRLQTLEKEDMFCYHFQRNKKDCQYGHCSRSKLTLLLSVIFCILNNSTNEAAINCKDKKNLHCFLKQDKYCSYQLDGTNTFLTTIIKNAKPEGDVQQRLENAPRALCIIILPITNGMRNGMDLHVMMIPLIFLPNQGK